MVFVARATRNVVFVARAARSKDRWQRAAACFAFGALTVDHFKRAAHIGVGDRLIDRLFCRDATNRIEHADQRLQHNADQRTDKYDCDNQDSR